MITFANAKINIGLQVLNRRTDGYHNLDTVFYPLRLYDVVEVVESQETRLIPSGIPIPNNDGGNLCLRAYHLLQKDFDLPPVEIYLHKNIPIGAGLGGGSADAAFVLKLLNEKFSLGMEEPLLIRYARQLGADCAFFIRNAPVFATGIGDRFEDTPIDLSAYHVVLVNPDIHVSTAEAYRTVKPNVAGRNLRAAVNLPLEMWKNHIFNDFEPGIFGKYPEIRGIKAALYECGALFAAMSGSGSSVYGIFDGKVELKELERKYRTYYIDQTG